MRSGPVAFNGLIAATSWFPVNRRGPSGFAIGRQDIVQQAVAGRPREPDQADIPILPCADGSQPIRPPRQPGRGLSVPFLHFGRLRRFRSLCFEPGQLIEQHQPSLVVPLAFPRLDDVAPVLVRNEGDEVGDHAERERAGRCRGPQIF